MEGEHADHAPLLEDHSEPRFSLAMVFTASAARPEGSMLSSRFP